MDKSLFNQASRWIWSDEANQTQNLYVAFRRTIETTGPVDTATLRITADTRYELFVNGEWVGHGPIRSWPSPWPVDTYDIGHLLDDGANTIAVLVSHYGIGTFQYIHKEPGLIMQIEWADGAGAHVVGTDDQWRAARHEGFEQATPRISCQQGWEEQFDARQAPGGQWRENGFDDSGWAQATVLRDAGESPHELFEARDIPFLSREALAPVRITGSDIVMPAPYTWSVNARPHLNSSDLTANMLIGAMLLATYIYSESAQTIEIHVPHLTRFGIKVGGVEALFDDMSLQVTELGVARANLKAGWNLMLVRMPMVAHAWSFWANFWSETPIKFAASPHDAASSPWRVLGPFETPSELDDVGPFNTSIFVRAERILPGATLSRFNAIWESATLDADDLSADWSRPIAAGLVAVNDVYALCASESSKKLSRGSKIKTQFLDRRPSGRLSSRQRKAMFVCWSTLAAKWSDSRSSRSMPRKAPFWIFTTSSSSSTTVASTWQRE